MVSGKSAPSLIRMVPGLIVSGTWHLSCVYSKAQDCHARSFYSD